jgi:hypothetical protein
MTIVYTVPNAALVAVAVMLLGSRVIRIKIKR